MPPRREAFLVKQRRLVIIYLFQYRPHQGLSYQPTAVRHIIPFTEPIQRTHFTLVQENGYCICAWCFVHIPDALEIQCQFDAGRKQITPRLMGKHLTVDRFRNSQLRLLESGKSRNTYRRLRIQLAAVTEINARI